MVDIFSYIQKIKSFLQKGPKEWLRQGKDLGQRIGSLSTHISVTLSEQTLLPSAILAFDTLMAFLSVFIALYLRIGEEFYEYTPLFLLKNMAVFSLISASIFLWTQTHRALWRYMTVEDLAPLALTSLLAGLIFFPLMILMGQNESLPRSMPALIIIVLIILLGAPRFIYRFIYDHHLLQKRRENSIISMPVLVIGSDDATDLFIREALYNPNMAYHPIGIVTLGKDEAGRNIHGIPILGNLKKLPAIFKKLETKQMMPQQVIITAETITEEQKQEIADKANIFGLTLLHVLHHFSWNVIPSKKE